LCSAVDAGKSDVSERIYKKAEHLTDTAELPPAAIREQIIRLQQSLVFAGSDRLMRFLVFVVEETLNGEGPSLKEAVIGNAVYGRDPPYDPRIDSTVRVEARRLRRKLDEYYEDEGRSDPVRISLPRGGYTPIFTVNVHTSDAARKEKKPAVANVFEEGAGAALAIMPLRSLSGDAQDDSFADGLTDELIFVLGRAQGLRVTSRTTAFQNRDRMQAPAALARELGVDAVLQGTVRRDSRTIRVTIEMSDPNGFVLLSDRFDALDHERMRLQEQIATTILSRFRFDSSRMRSMQAAPGPLALEANAKVYRARQLLDLQTPASLREASELFAQVAKMAPDYARGHSGVADCACDLFRLGLTDRETAIHAARRAVENALEIDPLSVEAHAAMGAISAFLERDMAASELNFRRALELGENARAARLYGVLLTIFGRYAEAERMFREARAIEPFSVQQDIAEAVSYYQTRRFSQMTAMGSHPDGRSAVEVVVLRALANVFSGRHDEARTLIGNIEHAVVGYPNLVFAVAEIEALLGKPERGAAALSEGGQGATWFARGALATALGEEEQAFAALEEAVARRELATAWLRTDPRFDSIRDRPRFLALTE